MIAKLAVKAIEVAGKAVKTDMGSPLAQDTFDLTLHIGKGILKITKEVLF